MADDDDPAPLIATVCRSTPLLWALILIEAFAELGVKVVSSLALRLAVVAVLRSLMAMEAPKASPEDLRSITAWAAGLSGLAAKPRLPA